MKPIKRKLMHEIVGDYIKSEIQSGRLKPGDRIVETRVAQILNVSQSPVREALRNLENSGLVEQKPFNGTYVKAVGRKDVQKFYMIRSALEKVGARMACEVITDTDIKELETILSAMEAAAERSDREHYEQINSDFHNKIIAIANYDLLSVLWEQCHIRTRLSLGHMQVKGDLSVLAKRHRSVLNALKTGSLKDVEIAVEAHLMELIDVAASDED